MSRYKKNPVIVEAFLYGVDDEPNWFSWAISDGTVKQHFVNDKPSWCEVRTLEGVMIATAKKDYIVKGVNDELYPCKKEVFAKTYTKVGE
jgi:hypothetical protein